MSTVLKTWTHPVSGELRVYVNDSRLWRGVKVWFTLLTIGSLRTIEEHIHAPSGQAYKEAEQVANEIGQSCGANWDDLLTLAEKAQSKGQF